nr:uncharacterized threonine-rich GPI-anchored glycoprotein PJ4664.02-like [Onthophagus taurus]
MSILCSRACAIVIIYCAVLILQPSGTTSVKDLKQSPKQGILKLAQTFQRSTLPSDDKMVTNRIEEVYVNYPHRIKRISHHGHPNKMWRSGRVNFQKENMISSNFFSKSKPLISFKDIESKKKSKRTSSRCLNKMVHSNIVHSSKLVGDRDSLKIVPKSRKRRRTKRLVNQKRNPRNSLILQYTDLSNNDLYDVEDFFPIRKGYNTITSRINKNIKSDDVVSITPRPVYNSHNYFDAITGIKLPIKVTVDPILEMNPQPNDNSTYGGQLTKKRNAHPVALQSVSLSIPNNVSSFNLGVPFTIAQQDVAITLAHSKDVELSSQQPLQFNNYQNDYNTDVNFAENTEDTWTAIDVTAENFKFNKINNNPINEFQTDDVTNTEAAFSENVNNFLDTTTVLSYNQFNDNSSITVDPMSAFNFKNMDYYDIDQEQRFMSSPSLSPSLSSSSSSTASTKSPKHYIQMTKKHKTSSTLPSTTNATMSIIELNAYQTPATYEISPETSSPSSFVSSSASSSASSSISSSILPSTSPSTSSSVSSSVTSSSTTSSISPTTSSATPSVTSSIQDTVSSTKSTEKTSITTKNPNVGIRSSLKFQMSSEEDEENDSEDSNTKKSFVNSIEDETNFLFPNSGSLGHVELTCQPESSFPEPIESKKVMEQSLLRKRNIKDTYTQNSLLAQKSDVPIKFNILRLRRLIKREANLSTTSHSTSESSTTTTVTQSDEGSSVESSAVSTTSSNYKIDDNLTTSGLTSTNTYSETTIEDNTVTVNRRDLESPPCVPSTCSDTCESSTCPPEQTAPPSDSASSDGAQTAAQGAAGVAVPAAVGVAVPAANDLSAFAANTANGGCELPCNMSNTLSEILHNVEMLAAQKIGSAEDFACSLNGSWSSETAGVKFNIVATDDKVLSINMDAPDVNRQTGFMSNSTWQLSAMVPIVHSGIIIINGINEKDKAVASFIGEYKNYPEKAEIIWGHWLINQKNDANGTYSQHSIFDALEKHSQHENHRVIQMGPLLASKRSDKRDPKDNVSVAASKKPKCTKKPFLKRVFKPDKKDSVSTTITAEGDGDEEIKNTDFKTEIATSNETAGTVVETVSGSSYITTATDITTSANGDAPKTTIPEGPRTLLKPHQGVGPNQSSLEPSAAFLSREGSYVLYNVNDSYNVMTELCQIKKTMTTSWNLGKVAMESGKKTSSVEQLLFPKEDSADGVYFKKLLKFTSRKKAKNKATTPYNIKEITINNLKNTEISSTTEVITLASLVFEDEQSSNTESTETTEVTTSNSTTTSINTESSESTESTNITEVSFGTISIESSTASSNTTTESITTSISDESNDSTEITKAAEVIVGANTTENSTTSNNISSESIITSISSESNDSTEIIKTTQVNVGNKSIENTTSPNNTDTESITTSISTASNESTESTTSITTSTGSINTESNESTESSTSNIETTTQTSDKKFKVKTTKTKPTSTTPISTNSESTIMTNNESESELSTDTLTTLGESSSNEESSSSTSVSSVGLESSEALTENSSPTEESVSNASTELVGLESETPLNEINSTTTESLTTIVSIESEMSLTNLESTSSLNELTSPNEELTSSVLDLVTNELIAPSNETMSSISESIFELSTDNEELELASDICEYENILELALNESTINPLHNTISEINELESSGDLFNAPIVATDIFLPLPNKTFSETNGLESSSDQSNEHIEATDIYLPLPNANMKEGCVIDLRLLFTTSMNASTPKYIQLVPQKNLSDSKGSIKEDESQIGPLKGANGTSNYNLSKLDSTTDILENILAEHSSINQLDNETRSLPTDSVDACILDILLDAGLNKSSILPSDHIENHSTNSNFAITTENNNLGFPNIGNNQAGDANSNINSNSGQITQNINSFSNPPLFSSSPIQLQQTNLYQNSIGQGNNVPNAVGTSEYVDQFILDLLQDSATAVQTTPSILVTSNPNLNPVNSLLGVPEATKQEDTALLTTINLLRQQSSSAPLNQMNQFQELPNPASSSNGVIDNADNNKPNLNFVDSFFETTPQGDLVLGTPMNTFQQTTPYSSPYGNAPVLETTPPNPNINSITDLFGAPQTIKHDDAMFGTTALSQTNQLSNQVPLGGSPNVVTNVENVFGNAPNVDTTPSMLITTCHRNLNVFTDLLEFAEPTKHDDAILETTVDSLQPSDTALSQSNQLPLGVSPNVVTNLNSNLNPGELLQGGITGNPLVEQTSAGYTNQNNNAPVGNNNVLGSLNGNDASINNANGVNTLNSNLSGQGLVTACVPVTDLNSNTISITSNNPNIVGAQQVSPIIGNSNDVTNINTVTQYVPVTDLNSNTVSIASNNPNSVGPQQISPIIGNPNAVSNVNEGAANEQKEYAINTVTQSQTFTNILNKPQNVCPPRSSCSCKVTPNTAILSTEANTIAAINPTISNEKLMKELATMPTPSAECMVSYMAIPIATMLTHHYTLNFSFPQKPLNFSNLDSKLNVDEILAKCDDIAYQNTAIATGVTPSFVNLPGPQNPPPNEAITPSGQNPPPPYGNEPANHPNEALIPTGQNPPPLNGNEPLNHPNEALTPTGQNPPPLNGNEPSNHAYEALTPIGQNTPPLNGNEPSNLHNEALTSTCQNPPPPNGNEPSNPINQNQQPPSLLTTNMRSLQSISNEIKNKENIIKLMKLTINKLKNPIDENLNNDTEEPCFLEIMNAINTNVRNTTTQQIISTNSSLSEILTTPKGITISVQQPNLSPSEYLNTTIAISLNNTPKTDILKPQQFSSQIGSSPSVGAANAVKVQKEYTLSSMTTNIKQEGTVTVVNESVLAPTNQVASQSIIPGLITPQSMQPSDKITSQLSNTSLLPSSLSILANETSLTTIKAGGNENSSESMKSSQCQMSLLNMLDTTTSSYNLTQIHLSQTFRNLLLTTTNLPTNPALGGIVSEVMLPTNITNISFPNALTNNTIENEVPNVATLSMANLLNQTPNNIALGINISEGLVTQSVNFDNANLNGDIKTMNITSIGTQTLSATNISPLPQTKLAEISNETVYSQLLGQFNVSLPQTISTCRNSAQDVTINSNNITSLLTTPLFTASIVQEEDIPIPISQNLNPATPFMSSMNLSEIQNDASPYSTAPSLLNNTPNVNIMAPIAATASFANQPIPIGQAFQQKNIKSFTPPGTSQLSESILPTSITSFLVTTSFANQQTNNPILTQQNFNPTNPSISSTKLFEIQDAVKNKFPETQTSFSSAASTCSIPPALLNSPSRLNIMTPIAATASFANQPISIGQAFQQKDIKSFTLPATNVSSESLLPTSPISFSTQSVSLIQSGLISNVSPSSTQSTLKQEFSSITNVIATNPGQVMSLTQSISFDIPVVSASTNKSLSTSLSQNNSNFNECSTSLPNLLTQPNQTDFNQKSLGPSINIPLENISNRAVSGQSIQGAQLTSVYNLLTPASESQPTLSPAQPPSNPQSASPSPFNHPSQILSPELLASCGQTTIPGAPAEQNTLSIGGQQVTEQSTLSIGAQQVTDQSTISSQAQQTAEQYTLSVEAQQTEFVTDITPCVEEEPCECEFTEKKLCDSIYDSTRQIHIHDPLLEPDYFPTPPDIDVYAYMESQMGTTESTTYVYTRNPLFDFLHKADAEPNSECEVKFMDNTGVCDFGIINAVENKGSIETVNPMELNQGAGDMNEISTSFNENNNFGEIMTPNLSSGEIMSPPSNNNFGAIPNLAPGETVTNANANFGQIEMQTSNVDHLDQGIDQPFNVNVGLEAAQCPVQFDAETTLFDVASNNLSPINLMSDFEISTPSPIDTGAMTTEIPLNPPQITQLEKPTDLASPLDVPYVTTCYIVQPTNQISDNVAQSTIGNRSKKKSPKTTTLRTKKSTTTPTSTTVGLKKTKKRKFSFFRHAKRSSKSVYLLKDSLTTMEYLPNIDNMVSDVFSSGHHENHASNLNVSIINPNIR